jgi:hypothetical protein
MLLGEFIERCDPFVPEILCAVLFDLLLQDRPLALLFPLELRLAGRFDPIGFLLLAALGDRLLGALEFGRIGAQLACRLEGGRRVVPAPLLAFFRCLTFSSNPLSAGFAAASTG